MKQYLSSTRISGIVVALFSGFALYHANKIKSSAMMTNDVLGPAAWPKFLSAAMLVLGIILIIFGDKTTKGGEETEKSAEGKEPVKVLVTILAMIAYIVLFERVGFLLITPIFLFVMTLYYGSKPHIALLYAAGFTAVLYVLFKMVLHILLPPIPFL